jgi:hypothetical protein
MLLNWEHNNFVTDNMSFLAVKLRQLQWAGFAARMEKSDLFNKICM